MSRVDFHFLVSGSDRKTSQERDLRDDYLDDEKQCQQLIEEFIADIEGYDAEKYRSELMAIREKNLAKNIMPANKAKMEFEYQSKKRLKTMSLLKNKVPHVKVEEKYLTKDEIYNQAKNLFKKRIDDEKEMNRFKRLESLKEMKFVEQKKKGSTLTQVYNTSSK